MEAPKNGQDVPEGNPSQQDSTESTNTSLTTTNKPNQGNAPVIDMKKYFDDATHKLSMLCILTMGTIKTCALNFPTKVVLVRVSTAELEDLKTKPSDPRELPVEVQRLTVMFMDKNPQDGTLSRYWLQATRAHIDRTCARMWRPPKRLRQQIRDEGTRGDALVELYKSCFPDRVVAVESGQSSDGQLGASLGQPPGRWEILLPNLVTFVSRDASDGGPAAEIKYLQPGERDKQDRAAFCRALTDSFVCERVRAPDIGARWHPHTSHMRRRFIGKFADSRLEPGEYSRTMLVFVAGVCSGEGVQARGGIGIVTKDTVHFHEANVQQRLFAAAKRLDNNPRKQADDDMHKMGRCLTAFKKPTRGHSRNLYPAGTSTSSAHVTECPLLGGVYQFPLERRGFAIDPDQFGTVQSRYKPAWKTLGDQNFDKDCYDSWLKAYDMAEEEARKQLDEAGGETEGKEAAQGEDDEGSASDEDEPDEPETANPGKSAVPTEASFSQQMEGLKLNSTPTPSTSNPTQSTTTTSTTPANTPQPKPKTPLPIHTPNRASARALLAAVQLTPLDLGHCTRLIIATPSDHAIDMATNRLHSLLERSSGGRGRPPLLSAKGNNPVEDEDIWWAFAGAVKDLAYQGVEVCVVKCGEGEGVYLDLGEGPWNGFDEKGGKFVFGMPQAVGCARDAVMAEMKREMEGWVVGGKKKRRRVRGVERWMGLFV